MYINNSTGIFINLVKVFRLCILVFVLAGCSDEAEKLNVQKTQTTGNVEDTLLIEDFNAITALSSHLKNNNIIDTSLFSLTNATQEDFTKAKNNCKVKLVYDTLGVKQNGRIKLRIENSENRFITFADVGEEEKKECYRYMGQLSTIGKYLVKGEFWEYDECYLIDKYSGNKLTLWNEPKLSPGDTYIANLSMMYGLEGVPNGFQIWKVAESGKKIEKIIEVDQGIWAAYNFYWESDSSLILSINPVERYHTIKGNLNDANSSYLRIQIK